MPKLLFEREWDTQPQYVVRPDKGRFPTVRSVLLPILGRGRMVDVCQPNSTIAYGANIGEWIDKHGRYTNNHADGVSEIEVSGACGYQKFSRIAIVRINVDTGTISDSAVSTNSGGAQWLMSGNLLILNKANTIQIGASTSIGPTVGVSRVVGITYDGTTVSFFADGQKYGSAASAQTFTIESSATLFARGGTANPNENLNCAMALHADFEGALPDSLMCLLTANPLLLFESEVVATNISASGVRVGGAMGRVGLVGATAGQKIAAAQTIGSIHTRGANAASKIATGSAVALLRPGASAVASKIIPASTIGLIALRGAVVGAQVGAGVIIGGAMGRVGPTGSIVGQKIATAQTIGSIHARGVNAASKIATGSSVAMLRPGASAVASKIVPASTIGLIALRGAVVGAQVGVITLSAERTLRIPAEYRTLRIPAENRTLIV